jgi:Glu-tRNA(Gln) amidotransferase subunit E-like FAD-binding protein
MPATRIDLGGADEWTITFVKNDKEYRIDSLVYTSILLEKSSGDENPPRETVINAMKEALSSHDGLNDHDLWAMSVRLSKVMGRAGNA